VREKSTHAESHASEQETSALPAPPTPPLSKDSEIQCVVLFAKVYNPKNPVNMVSTETRGNELIHTGWAAREQTPQDELAQDMQDEARMKPVRDRREQSWVDGVEGGMQAAVLNSTEGLNSHFGGFGDKMALQSCPKLEQGSGPFCP
jgi:hypothetical protein